MAKQVGPEHWGKGIYCGVPQGQLRGPCKVLYCICLSGTRMGNLCAVRPTNVYATRSWPGVYTM